MTDTTPLQDARANLTAVIQSDQSFTEKARGALEVGRQYLSVANGHLTQIDQGTDHWESLVSTDGADGTYPEGLTLDLQTSYCRKTLTADSPVTLHDAPNQGWADDPAFEEHELHCYHGTALHVNEEPYGTICFVSQNPRREPFTETETLFIEYLTQCLERELERDQHETELTRQTNLSLVLNRILRHNLRNDLAVIRGYTQFMADQLDNTANSKTVLRKIDRIMALCEKARQLDQIIATESERGSTKIISLVNGVVEDVSQEFPGASITVECDDTITAAVFPSFERAIRELLENAAKHGGDEPTITITIDVVPNGIEIDITDDGSGLASHEIAVLDKGSETPLTHGSGLGLWLAYWIVTSHDGSIEATNTGTGTTLSISIPRTANPDGQKQLQSLARTHDQYQAAFDEAGDGMTIINDEARIVDLNDEAAAIFGTEKQELLGRSIREFLPNDFDFDAEWNAIQTDKIRRDEMPVISADGGVSSIEYTAKTDVVPGLHLLTSRDITERKARQRELTQTSERFKAFVENSNDLISVVNADGIAQYQSPAVERILGYDPGALVGANVFEYIHPDDREQITSQFEQLVSQSEPTTDVFEYRFKHADGSWVWLESTASSQTATPVDGFVINSRDVTDRKERERALRETTQRLESIIEISPDPILALDTNGTFTVWNEAAEDVFGMSADTVIGEQFRSLSLFDGDQTIQFEEKFERVVAGETIAEYEIAPRNRQGAPVRLNLSAVPLRDGSGTVTGVIAIATEITEPPTEEPAELLRQNDRLEEFASIVSHDLRNPLGVAEGRLELATSERDSEHFPPIKRAHNRMRVLIDDLLTLARTGETVTEFAPLDLAGIATECWMNVETAGGSIVVEHNRTIQGDESRLKQLFENLMRNAIEHGGDDVTVTVGELDDGFFVEDDGSGIPAEIRDDIFETGFSTNQDGTGFGLNIVQQIVEAHGWTIRVTESPTGGARFEITGVEFGAA